MGKIERVCYRAALAVFVIVVAWGVYVWVKYVLPTLIWPPGWPV